MGIVSIIKSLFGESVNFSELIENGALIIDVRTPLEFSSSHVSNSKNIPLDILKSELKQLKNKEVILVCKSGARASRAKLILQQNGIIAHNAGAWQNLDGI